MDSTMGHDGPGPVAVFGQGQLHQLTLNVPENLQFMFFGPNAGADVHSSIREGLDRTYDATVMRNMGREEGNKGGKVTGLGAIRRR